MTRAALTIRGDSDRAQAANWCRNSPAGTRIEWKAPRRSIDQNALMWARLTQLSRELVWHGQRLSAEDWKDVLSAGLKRTRLVPGVDGQSFVMLGLRTSDMSKAEFGELLTLMEVFAAEHGVVFLDQQPIEDDNGQENGAPA